MLINLWVDVIPAKRLIDFLDVFFPICNSLFCLSECSNCLLQDAIKFEVYLTIHYCFLVP